MDNTSDIMNRILEDYPEIWKDARLFKAVVSDLMPGDGKLLLRNLLGFCVAEYIPEELVKTGAVEKIDLHRYVVCLMKNYGCTEELATKAVLIWADALNANTTDIANHAIVLKLSEIDRLKQLILELRGKLIAAVSERDELVNVICPQLELRYVQIFGVLEIEIFEAQCNCKRLKRQIEMMKAKLNRQEPVDEKTIEEIIKILAAEFKEFQDKIDAEKEKINTANEKVANTPPDTILGKLKKLYRALVKKLHPDIHPDLSQEDRELFNRVVEAYKNNDLEQMELLNELASGNEVELYEETVDTLQAEADRLQILLDKVNKEIEDIKSRYPYNMKETLDDENEVEIEKERLMNMLQEYQDKISIYEAKIKAMEEQ